MKIPTSEETQLALEIVNRISANTDMNLHDTGHVIAKWTDNTNRSIITCLVKASEAEEYAAKLRIKGVKCTVESEILFQEWVSHKYPLKQLHVYIKKFLKSRKHIAISKKFGL